MYRLLPEFLYTSIPSLVQFPPPQSPLLPGRGKVVHGKAVWRPHLAGREPLLCVIHFTKLSCLAPSELHRRPESNTSEHTALNKNKAHSQIEG